MQKIKCLINDPVTFFDVLSFVASLKKNKKKNIFDSYDLQLIQACLQGSNRI